MKNNKKQLYQFLHKLGSCLEPKQTNKQSITFYFIETIDKQVNLSLVTRKPVFWVCDQVRLKLACAGTEAR